MKKRLLIPFLVPIIAGLPMMLQAQENSPKDAPKPSKSDRHDKRDRHQLHHPKEREQALLLKRLLELPPERLDALQATVNRIRNMSPEEKKRLKERLENFSRLDEQEKHRRLESFRDNERKRWDDFHRRHKDLPKEQRYREQRRIHSLPPHERRAYFEQLRRNKQPLGRPGSPPPRHPHKREGPPRPSPSPK